MLADLLVMGGGAVAAAGMLWHWRRIETFDTPGDPVAEAPPELRTAVLVVCDPGQLTLMWPALRLGRWDVGYPSIISAAYTSFGMTIEVQILGGQKLTDWTDPDTLDALAQYLAVPAVTATGAGPGFVRLDLRVYDTLADSAPVTDLLAYGVDLEAVPVGVTEDFDTWRLRVMYSHILIAGATSSGKGSVLWSIINGLGPAIKTGLVDILLGDPKGGMEFGRGEDRLWTDFQWTADGIIAMLTTAEADMQERAARFKAAGVRKFTPSIEEPLTVIIIDEYAALSAFATREQVTEGLRLLGLILTQGRAVGYSVIVALQDPSKENMPNRQLFSVRVGLRFDEPTQTSMVHGHGAKERGALCHDIPATTPGVAYVGADGSSRFVRVRAYWVDDDDADRIVDTYSPQQPDLSPQVDWTGFDPDDLGDSDSDSDSGRAAA
ncbi:FtsK/SpoIIIE domain-containing protein [Nocardia sp. CNY236]|uniref:FtsK/SpoIIIE domain-containing protein n=1 Tax=Nocardia sp. CNY236 TaxID=1169152 RepID=UPI000688AB24|nr:FtsK/SpoIIIE domain-containing protein [Nocardia sp. CNY236]